MHLVDTHIHLYAEEFRHDREKLIQKAQDNGIRKFYLPNIDSGSIDAMLELEKSYPNTCFAMMGLHPCSVNERVEDELAIHRKWLEQRKFSGIGEIGIDLYWDKTFFEEQKHAFKTQIQWALEFAYPIVIHCRNAFDEIIELLKTFTRLPPGIFHCFSGNLDQAIQVLELGQFKLGIGGVLTFKNSGLDKVIENIDIQNIVLETDAPYLAPVPHRGKRNEPVYLLDVAKKLAAVKNLSVEEVCSLTSSNAAELFKNA